MNLFVYGSLLSGLERASLLPPGSFRAPALLPQADLYDLGPYPGLKAGDGVVPGELYQIDRATLHRLDQVEGYRATAPETSLYLRRQVRVRRLADGQIVDSFTYIYAHDVDRSRRISGDYRSYRLQRSQPAQWLAAYDPLISTAHLTRQAGPAAACKKGSLGGFQLVFNRQAGQLNAVHANLKYHDSGHCPVVAWQLANDRLHRLDAWYGVPHRCLRLTVTFASLGETLPAQVYIAHPDQLRLDLPPEPAHVQAIRAGYHEHGLDPAYLDNALSAAAG